MKPTTYIIPVKFDIWDTQYTITDHDDHLIIKCPCRKYERTPPARFRLKRGSTCKQHSTARSRKQIYLKAFGATYETYYSP